MNALVHDNCYYLCRSEILEAAFNKITKKIPASKYQLFLKKRLVKNTNMITEIRIKISNLISKRRYLKMRALNLKNSQSNVTETNVKLCNLICNKLNRQLQVQSEVQKSITANLSEY